jgi:hypothetical protein
VCVYIYTHTHIHIHTWEEKFRSKLKKGIIIIIIIISQLKVYQEQIWKMARRLFFFKINIKIAVVGSHNLRPWSDVGTSQGKKRYASEDG